MLYFLKSASTGDCLHPAWFTLEQQVNHVFAQIRWRLWVNAHLRAELQG